MAEINQQKEIKLIKDQVEAVRKLPDVYIGALGNPGFINMYREILQNSLDEIIKGNTLDKNIIVSFDARNHTCIIEDNGQGIKLDMLAPVFSELHSSSNYDKKDGSGDYSSGKNGMGATITNFLSKFFIVESYRMDGTAAKVEFNEGRLSSKGTQTIKCPKGKHGLITTFAPSEMMGEITVDDIEIQNLTWILCHLCVVGTRITFNTINPMGQKRTVQLENKRGIVELIDTICEQKVCDPIYFTEDNGTMKVEVLFTYDVANMDDPNITSFANMCPTTAGTHVDGFLDGLVKYFRDYMNKIYLAGNKKLQVTAQDIRTGLRAVVSVFHLHAMFTGQSKQIFSKEDIKPYVSKATVAALQNWATNNPGDLQKISKYLKSVCEIRTKSDNEKIKMSDKYTASVISGYPSKYKKSNNNKGFELWICEGDSAASGMENNRDKQTQGIMPIRGKIVNAFTTPTKKYFENAEVAGLFKIMGYQGYSKNFDPDKFKPSKIVIATDADADGKHIECLLFGMFLRYLPWVITGEKLYVANPPLYGVSLGKNKMKFFADNVEYVEYVQSMFCKDNKICDVSGKEYSKKEITKIIHRNMDYVRLVNHIAGVYAIDPYLLEYILYHRALSFNKLKQSIQKEYKFLTIEQAKDTILIRGLVGSNYQTIFLNNRLLNDCAEIINMINRSDDYYLINGQRYTIYGLMAMFNSFEPKNLTRYKGLGEMPPKMLGESTVIPNMGRTLKQYTIQDVKKELKLITEMQSDKSAFTKGIVVKKEDII